MLDRRAVLAAIAASALPLQAGAQAFPSRTITIVVPYPPAVAAAMAKESVRANLARQGLPVAVKTPAEMSAMLPGEVAKWAAVVKTANVTVD